MVLAPQVDEDHEDIRATQAVRNLSVVKLL